MAWVQWALGPMAGFSRGQTVEGEPYRIGGRELRPLARVREFGRRGRWRTLWIRPLAVVEVRGGESRRLPVSAGGVPAIALVVGLAAPVTLYLVATRLLGRSRRR